MCTCVSLNKEEYLDAKSDDTLDVLFETEKRYSRCGFPSKQRPILGRRKPRWQKKEKNGGPKSPKKIVFSLVLEKEDFVSRDTLFGRDEK